MPENSPASTDLGIAEAIARRCAEAEARINWGVCISCLQDAALDEFNRCGHCRARAKARRERLRKWARDRKIKGFDSVGVD